MHEDFYMQAATVLDHFAYVKEMKALGLMTDEEAEEYFKKLNFIRE
jgi:hypothetical protein